MTSFVTEVLATAGKLEKEDFNSKIVKLSQRIDEVKIQTYECLVKRYEEFYPSFAATMDLSSRIEIISEEMHSLTNKIENEIKNQLNVSTNEFQDLSRQLNESVGVLNILNKLLHIHEKLGSIDKLIEEDYLQAAKCLKAVRVLLDKPSHEREEEIRIFKGIQTEYRVKQEKLIYDLSEIWNEKIKMDVTSDKENKKKIELQICSVTVEDNKLETLIQALYFVGVLENKLKGFAKRLMHHILNPLMKQRAVLRIVPKTYSEVLEISFDNSDIISKPSDVFSQIEMIFNFLHKTLFHVCISENQEIAMSSLGSVMAKDLIDTIIQDCLCHAIPTNNKDLEKFDIIIIDAEKFQEKLVALNFLSSDQTSLIDYAKNVNVLFANKKCQQILEKARHLMLSELHDAVKISNDYPLGDLPQIETDGIQVKKAKLNSLHKSYLSETTFRLPKCQISTTVQQLMHLTYNTLHAATSSSTQCAIQLFYTTRNIFEMFCDVVPMYHKSTLSNLPYLAALHHNNCMYIAHHLLVLGHQFRREAIKPLNQGAATYVDLVPLLRRLGTEHFLQQMAIQRNQLMELLSAAEGFQHLSRDENVHPMAERAVKQCMHHLERLANVWRPVLPLAIYQKAIGTLLSSVLLEIVNRIIALEDISASDASQLHTIFNIIIEKAPDLFQGEDESKKLDINLYQHVPKWMKFKELLIILNASLHDILDRWADGKGPLAQEYSSTEVKQLVRALFQNTDRRAAALSKIK